VKKYRLFLSYCSKDSDYADMFEERLSRSEYKYIFDVSRYTRDVKYRDSFVDFMDGICEHDIVVTIISDAYLKSIACMYEVSKLLAGREKSYKFFYIVISKDDVNFYSQIPTCQSNYADIFCEEGRLNYIHYWSDKKMLLEQARDALKEPFKHIELLGNIKRLDHILYYEIGPLMQYLIDHRYMNFLELLKNGFDVFFDDFIKKEFGEREHFELSPEEKLERVILEETQVIYEPGTVVNERYYVGSLPPYITIVGDKAFFNGEWYSKEIIKAEVREEGLDAWGYYVDMPMGIWFRRTSDFGKKGYGWYKTQKHDHVYIESVGNGLESIELKNDEIIWKSYIAYDINSM